MAKNEWQNEELLLALHLYCRIPFSKLDKSNPEIIRLSNSIGRTPSAVAMKACNFASLDPALSQKGLTNVSQADRMLWNEFMNNSTEVAEKAEALYESRILTTLTPKSHHIGELIIPYGETEISREVKARRVQQFFRRTVLESYNNRCAISGLAIPQLLVASHIIPWANAESRRADPTNGITLNALYDKAFDRGLITFDDSFRMVLSTTLKKSSNDKIINEYFIQHEGKSLEMPYRFRPDLQSFKVHRDLIFQKS